MEKGSIKRIYKTFKVLLNRCVLRNDLKVVRSEQLCPPALVLGSYLQSDNL